MKALKTILTSGLLAVFLFGCANESQTADADQVNSDRKIVSFMGVGDNLIHQTVFEDAQTSETAFDFKPIYDNVATDIAAADLAYINQETLIGGDERGFSGYPAFNTPSDMVDSLVGLGFDVVSGANNHTLDVGSEGIINTRKYWGEHEDEILFTGAFETQEQRDTIPVIEKNGMTFSFLTYTFGTNGIEPEAPYQVNYFDPELITSDVQRAQEISDFVVVFAHWGDEDTFELNQMQTENAQLFADLGVDVVVGTHPHTIQPIEWVTGETGSETLVVYSLGNFIAGSLHDYNVLGGSVNFNFVQQGEDHFIENVFWEPTVIHYEMTTPGDISTRENYAVYKLSDYSNDLAAQHGLNTYGANDISVENFQRMTTEVIDSQFLKAPAEN